jgi:hypothetical protein
MRALRASARSKSLGTARQIEAIHDEVLPRFFIIHPPHVVGLEASSYEAATPQSMRKSLPVMNAPSGPMRSAPTFPTSSETPGGREFPLRRNSVTRRGIG